MSRSWTVVEVNELILDGFRAEDRESIVLALKHEIAVILARHGAAWPYVVASDRATVQSDIELPLGARPQEVGRRLARALFAGGAARREGG